MSQNELEKILGKVIDQKVTPRLEKIEGTLSKVETSNQAIMEQVVKNSGDINEIKVDIGAMQDDVNDLGFAVERVETRLNSVASNQDDIYIKSKQLNRRVLRLESKKS